MTAAKAWDDLGSRFVLNRAVERVQSLVREIARIAAKDFAFPLPGKLLDLLREEAEAIGAELSKLDQDPVIWNPQTPSEDRLDAIRTLATKMQWVHVRVSVVAGVDSSRLPFEMVGAFEELAAGLMNCRAVEFILQPKFEYNYTVLPLRKLFKQPAMQDALLLSMPSADCASVALHTLFLHELGHPAFQQRIEKLLRPYVVVATAGADSALTAQIDAEVNRRLLAKGVPPPPQGPPHNATLSLWQLQFGQERLTLFDECVRVLFAWTEELWCDLCAARLVGPAYLCAYEALILPFLATNEPSHSHPDSWLRLQVLNSFLNDEAAREPQLQSITALFGTYAQPLSGLKQPAYATLPIPYQVAQYVLSPASGSNFLEVLTASVLAIVPSPITRPTFLDEIGRGLQQLEQLIPIDPYLHARGSERAGSGPGAAGEEREPPRLTAEEVVSFVFYCYWLFKLKGYGQWATRFNWQPERCDEVLTQMSLKALEAADLRRRFLKQNRGL